MQISIKERLKYKDISWLMSSVNLEDVLVRLDSIIDHKSGDEIRAFCPDHHLFTGRKSSHPNWTVNTRTGETFCFTEGRGSNLVWTVCRIFDCGPKEATKFLTGIKGEVDETSLDIRADLYRKDRLLQPETRPGEGSGAPVRGLEGMAKEIENHLTSDALYAFFMNPPGKKYPTNITKETVDRYNVFERTWGSYANRVIVPFHMEKELVGFCAVDLLGKDEWLKRHPLKQADDYRKSLYPLGFTSGACLFGYDDCEKGADYLIIVEGAREVMKLWQEGFTNAVAILGSHMSDKHLELIGSLAPKKLLLMFDGDEVGVEITTRVATKAGRVFSKDRIKGCYPPRGKDPKNLTGIELRALVENS